MNSVKQQIGYAALALALALLVVPFLLPVDAPGAKDAGDAVVTECAASASDASVAEESVAVEEVGVTVSYGALGGVSDDDADEDVSVTPEENALADWERVFDEIVKAQVDDGYKPSEAEVSKFKNLFDRLTEEQKIEQIPHAQNMFSDASFGFLKAILLDQSEPKDVLASIYHDLLNRPEELKYPVLRDVYKVKNHPLRGEIKELDDMLGDLGN